MNDGIRSSRRVLCLSLSGAILSGCGAIPFITSKAPSGLGPRQTLDVYCSALTNDHLEIAESLMSSSFRGHLGPRGVQTLLHSVRSIRITDAVDAVSWANQLGAHLPAPPPDRQEYLLTLQIVPSDAGRDVWSVGMNRRFVDLVRQNGQWRIDGIGVSPGVLVTGQSDQTTNQNAFVIPTAPLRLGSAPIDRAIYTARQDAVDHGAIPWATDPIEVVKHDGPSFGLNAGDPVEVLRRDVDPSSLVPRIVVVAHQGANSYQVTLTQPIRAGEHGIWAIADVEAYPGKGD